MAMITDPDLLEDSSADDGSQEVYINTTSKTIKLVVAGNLSNTGVQGDNGVTLKALYSFLSIEIARPQPRRCPHCGGLLRYRRTILPQAMRPNPIGSPPPDSREGDARHSLNSGP